MHQMTATYERLISLFQNLRTAYRQKHAQDHDAKGAKRDLWLNLTSYVNPSPWWLAYVNSLWIQVSQDTGYDSLGETDLARMMTYRDDRYHAFIRERAIQVPQKYFYNHEPIFAHRATAGLLDHPIQASVSEFRDYLYFIGSAIILTTSSTRSVGVPMPRPFVGYRITMMIALRIVALSVISRLTIRAFMATAA